MDIYTFDDKSMEQRLQDYSEIFKSNDSRQDFKNFFESNKKSMELCNVIRKIPKYPNKGNLFSYAFVDARLHSLTLGLNVDRPTEVFGVLTFVRHWIFKGNFKVFGKTQLEIPPFPGPGECPKFPHTKTWSLLLCY